MASGTFDELKTLIERDGGPNSALVQASLSDTNHQIEQYVNGISVDNALRMSGYQYAVNNNLSSRDYQTIITSYNQNNMPQTPTTPNDLASLLSKNGLGTLGGAGLVIGGFLALYLLTR